MGDPQPVAAPPSRTHDLATKANSVLQSRTFAFLLAAVVISWPLSMAVAAWGPDGMMTRAILTQATGAPVVLEPIVTPLDPATWLGSIVAVLSLMVGGPAVGTWSMSRRHAGAGEISSFREVVTTEAKT